MSPPTRIHRRAPAAATAHGELVPGDVIALSAGDMIPADVRLLAAKDLFVSQSALTGEVDAGGESRDRRASRPRRDVDPLELHNICFMGTNVVSGTATAVVVATGDAAPTSARWPRASLGRARRHSVRHGVQQGELAASSASSLVMVPIVFLINGFTKGDWLEALLFGARRRRRPDAGDAADDRHRRTWPRARWRWRGTRRS